jgi:hypothetical protein
VAKASFLTHRIPDRAHAPRGYAAQDAPRLLHWDAERLGRRYHAERGNDQPTNPVKTKKTAIAGGFLVRPNEI